ncbi:hypothetical protein TraAM80_05302 [Trypanosoma rangeli]|uniref:Uncharacterized protein n=1 Tax=Trypanosoma rangeli TaxID=5698 RepID=A0A3R7NKX5_TRYRA|nr:uncharacterized protein TraAM80_05302 [Trypanosoma rangeli]RNF04151.1 hypothetical protein TraAM80_05302 [Trypanosoma rangeli]|eukprot:RNF04151.1 hypothetical protein TraAM80_05302 [Trypanosoma rangeli]
MRDDPAWALFATTVVSHLPMIPTAYLFLQRRYVYEVCIAAFGLSSSLLYHTCQSFDATIFLDELGWHRLDNIAVLAWMGMWFVFICTFKDPVVERASKYFTLLVSIIFEEKDPWNLAYTVAPILVFACIPLVVFLYDGRLPVVDYRHLLAAALLMGLAVPFFIAGLNDAKDPCRIYHGLWHLLGGIASYFMWMMVKTPGATGPYPKMGSIVLHRDTLL